MSSDAIFLVRRKTELFAAFTFAISAQRRWSLALRVLSALTFCLISWLAFHLLQPSASYQRATAALDSREPEALRLERVQYALLRIGNQPDWEPHANLLKARFLLAENRPTAALDLLSVAELDPDLRTRTYVLAGEALYSAGQTMDAISAWNKAIEVDPRCADAYRWLGVVFYESGSFLQAGGYLEEVARLDPTDPRPHRLIGLMWSYLDTYPQAIEAYRESLRRDPTYWQAEEVRLELARALNELHEYDEALAVLDKLDVNGDVLCLQATCCYGLGNVTKTLVFLEKALQTEPRHFNALCLRAKIALDRSEPRLALGFARRAAQIIHNNPEVLNLLIASHLRLGQRDQAKTEEARLKEVTRLVDEYHSLISSAASEPMDADVRFRVGAVAEQLELKEDAKRWFRAALSIEPKHREATAALQKLDSPWKENYSPN